MLVVLPFLQAIVNEANAAAHQAKAKLDAIDKLNAAAQQKKGQGVGSASERTRTSITSGEQMQQHAGLYPGITIAAS